jgi:hypothetical protein
MSQINVNEIYDGNGTDSAKLYGVSMRYGGTNFVNRIINGNMVIDQRNAGASVTQGTVNLYPVDRFLVVGSVASKFTAQRSSTVPDGFNNSVICTSSSAYSVGTSETFVIAQRIEGFNVADLGWGSAGAQSVTLSFWVQSSLTGTFGGALRNSASDRSYPFSYTISSANTWEQKFITVAGDTTGTWLTDNGVGINLTFSLGTGSTLSGTAGAWAGSNFISATGAVSVVGTNGATFYITGVQLEAGSVATPFERRPYGTELALCMRYFEKSYNASVAPGTASSNLGAPALVPFSTSVNFTNLVVTFKQTKRATPTLTVYNPETGATGTMYNFGNLNAAASFIGDTGCVITNTASATLGFYAYAHYTASAEL